MTRHGLFRRVVFYGCKVFSHAPKVKLKPTMLVSLAAAAPFSYSESEATVPGRPSEPASFPVCELTHEFLVRQSCIVSADSAGAVLTRYVTAVQDAVDRYTAVTSELANLYENSVHALTDEGGEKVVELRTRCKDLRGSLSDLEIMSHFVRKLLDANAEVCFLAGAEFASLQASERLQSAQRTLSELFERVKKAELDLASAHQTHIGNVDRAVKVLEEMRKSAENARGSEESDTEEESSDESDTKREETI